MKIPKEGGLGCGHMQPKASIFGEDRDRVLLKLKGDECLLSALEREELLLALADLYVATDEAEFARCAKRFGEAWAFCEWGSNDPFDDVHRLFMIYTLFCSPSLDSIIPGERLSNKHSWKEMVDRWANIFSQVFQNRWSSQQWLCVLNACLDPRYGGTTCYIKKRPSEKMQAAARSMTPKQLMETFGISRAHAYRLVSKKK